MAKEGKGKFTHKGQEAVLFSSDLNFGQPVYKETKTSTIFNGSF